MKGLIFTHGPADEPLRRLRRERHQRTAAWTGTWGTQRKRFNTTEQQLDDRTSRFTRSADGSDPERLHNADYQCDRQKGGQRSKPRGVTGSELLGKRNEKNQEESTTCVSSYCVFILKKQQ